MINTSIILASIWLAVAVQSSATIEQVTPASGTEVDRGTEQGNISPRRPNVDDTAQLGSSGLTSPDQVQLTVEKSGEDVTQLSKQERNAQPPQNLSDRKQGFNTRVVKVEGTDRCSAELLSSRDREYCQRIIENRSADYTGPKEIPLTPEQELLARRNPQLIDGGTDAAIKRLANGRDSADDADIQEIASTVLDGQNAAAQTAQEQPAENNLSAQTQALIDAIVRNATDNPRL